jgi:adenosylcobyric acid synthase
MQARACGIEPAADMNPVLLKPGGDRTTHVVLMGQPHSEASAVSYRELKTTLRQAVLNSYDRLRAQHDVVVCEGAGSPAEINLRDTDLSNMWLADQRNLPTLIVGDIDRGGLFAALFGTLALLDARDQSLVCGFVVNKFRGDERLLTPGLRMITELTGRDVLGVVPWLPSLVIDTEDSLSMTRIVSGGPPVGDDTLTVAAIRLPRTSNSTDLDALGCEPGVVVQWTVSPAEVAAADLVVLPGSRATVHDLQWLRRSGIADVIVNRARRGRPVLGICGGHQMLAESIVDDVESHTGRVAGLGLLPIQITFAAKKLLGRPRGSQYGVQVETAYEIHHGVARATGSYEPFLDGHRRDAVWGTSWHGTLDTDAFRREFLREVATAAGRRFVPAADTDVAALKDRQLEVLGDAVADHLDTAALERLITHGAPPGLPRVSPRLIASEVPA